ncbi:B-cell linker protein isoform X2 [Brienomyrus brachyistius]|uniref:B-cell linker protein isoform X2 n=1 Tax=Brienomyrus brachyistius TaxID=42636 RepID=UPI0020B1A12B|nr:B-cell linker protein isoform X2 [Brienomyrus brachyistius]
MEDWRAMEAKRLPTKEQCEAWSSWQVGSFLCQNGMKECSDTVKRMNIDGRRLLTLSHRDLNSFSLIHQPQLQKMVQDIKKNDGSIINRLKKLKTKRPPRVPNRDYNQDDPEEAQSSGSEFESDTYEDPLENQDDSYEPPPSECSKRTFMSASPPYFPKGEYLDSRESRRGRTCQPTRKNQAAHAVESDEDYIKPEDEDDNYIDPTANAVSDTRGTKAKEQNHSVITEAGERSHSPDVYEVPDVEEKEMCTLKSRIHTASVPPVASPRMHSKNKPTSPEPLEEDEYEVCDTDERDTETNSSPRDHFLKQDKPILTSLKAPIPRPRERKKPNIPLKPKLLTSDAESEARSVVNVQPSMAASPSSNFSLKRSGLSQESTSHTFFVNRGNKPLPQGRSSTEEKDAGVYQKAWYAGACDRKTAEDALTHTNKDGCFLVRKSSGQDAQQPYTLVVFYKRRVYNIPVRFIQSTQHYALGREKKGEERFSSVSSIIENHQKNALVLIDSQSNTKDSTKLCYAVKP